MPEFEVNVVFDVYCSCGAALCNQSSTQDYRRGHGGTPRSLTVEPCQSCLDRIKDEGYDEGYTKAQQEAEDDRA
jgi:hypothetical protein